MFKFKKLKTILIITFLALTLSFSNFAYAVESTANTIDENSEVYTTDDYYNILDTDENSYTTDDSEYGSAIKNDVYIHENTVNITNNISGNVFIIGQDVTIDSTIDGNVFICANNVNFTENSYIYSDVFVCAKSVNIEGYLYDLYNMSNSLTIGKTGYIIRDVHSGCNNFSLSGIIKRNAKIGCETISLSDSANIGGNLSYSSENQANIDNDNIVSGKITYTKSNNKNNLAKFTMFSYIFTLISTLVYALIIILIIVLAMNKFTDKSENILINKFWPAIGYGALGLIVIPLIAILLCFTIIGIWAAIALIAIYIFALTIAMPIFAVALGKYICSKMKKTTKPMIVLMSILMVIAIWLLKNIPFIGWIISLIVTLLGFGIILYSIFHKEIVMKNKEVKK